ncbi:hypothetical protein MKJ04_22670 [Pontibacter sp. E15-1]|uniref:hypothetical protein n=1 Tax=Pontibacter sp. E15-1 TaxID=2919918 RepID=UPI001F500A8F|nr:hypothetical protein [Pontibacter sp. E15-1]MCJ8167659.1 hypothetical protein [Pontibacter sp. E15-1]
MKNIFLFIPIILLFFACNTQEYDEVSDKKTNLYSKDIKQISGTNSITDFDAYLLDLNGQEVTDLSHLKPNAVYDIVVESKSPAHFRIKFSDGFTVINAPASISNSRRTIEVPSTSTIFTIKTNQDAASGVYVNIVPIHRNGKDLIRERSKNFLFPASLR